MKLSVIICVYNTDKTYLEKCLTSVTSSTLTDYEIVFVDDGSTVDYSEILSKYKVKYAKTENKGHFAARLYGIEISEGEYITFVDSDDTVSKNYHMPMVMAAEKHGADIVINSWAFHTERTKRCCLDELTMANDVSVSGEEILPFFTSCRGRDHSYFVQWNKVIRRETVLSAISELRGTGLCDKRLTYAEDALLSFFYFKHARKAISINSGFYFYRIHSAQSVVAADSKKLQGQIDCMRLVLDTMLSSLPSGKYTEIMKEDILYWKGLMSRTHYSNARSAKFYELYPIIKEAYGVEKLRLSKLSDGKAYIKSELLGKNFDDIDAALTEVFLADYNVKARYDKSYVFLKQIISTSEKLSKKEISYENFCPDIEIPKPQNRLFDRLIHNVIVYEIGILLFKKGSRVRNFLKKHL